jgi:hypothetical protein
MAPSKTNTFSGSLVSDEKAKQFRNQATGIGQTRRASEQTGAVRAQRAINAAPPSQLVCADRSYPAPGPYMGPDGALLDRMTGDPWVGPLLCGTRPALGGPN